MAALIDDADSVLVVIDTQPGFLGKLDPSQAVALERRIAWLVRLALALDVPLVVTEEEPERNGGTAATIDALIPVGVTRHTKPAFGLATCPPIVADVERPGRGTAVLCGLETDVCVAQSALGLDDRGMRVVVVLDAVGAPGDAHDQGLVRMRDAGIELVGLKGLAYEWLRTVERSWAIDAGLPDPPPRIVL
ncbi:MAG: isochorismatase family protein [Actinomycetota bacterium]